MGGISTPPALPPSAVLIAVRERYDRLVLDLPAAQTRAADALRAYEAEVAKLDALKKDIEDLRGFLNSQGEQIKQPDIDDSVTMSANMQILMRSRAILSDGKQRHTRELYEDLLRQGQLFTAINPVQRLSQLLSQSDWFVSDRARGWSLAKSENPAGAGSSGATQSSADAERKEEPK